MQSSSRLYIYLALSVLILTNTCGETKAQVEGDVKPKVARDASDTLEYYYLLRGTDVQGNLNYGLLNAAADGDTLGIRWLIENGAEVDVLTYEKFTPLSYATARNEADAVRMLLAFDASIDIASNYGETALIIAVRNQNVEIAELLLRSGADINYSDRFGATPLHYASASGNFYMADMLIYYDAATFSKDHEGTTPLMAAVWSGSADISDLLIQNDANPDERDNNGFTPFLIAAQNGDTLLMELLLGRKIDLYEKNNFNYDALNLAIMAKSMAAVEYLLRKGDKWADPGRKVISPYTVAEIYKRENITSTLKSYKLPETKLRGIDQIYFSASVKHCFRDYQTGLSIGVREPRWNMGFFAGCDLKPFATRVLVKESDLLYYQYRDKGSLAFAGLSKDIPLTDRLIQGNWNLSATLAAAYSFGNRLRGSDYTPENKFRLVPSLGVRYIKESLSFNIAAEYYKTGFFRNGPVWLRIGVSYSYFIKKTRAPAKSLKWF